MVGPGEGKGSCLTCRAEMCRAKTCRAAHVINSMDVRAHDKPGLSPTVFSLIKTLFFFFFRIDRCQWTYFHCSKKHRQNKYQEKLHKKLRK